MITFLGLIIVSLAAFRITRFLVLDSLIGFNPESGSRVSEWVDAFAYGEITGEDRSFVRGKIGDLLTCTYCLGFWVSLMSWFAFMHGSVWVRDVVVVFAVAGLQVVLQQLVNAFSELSTGILRVVTREDKS